MFTRALLFVALPITALVGIAWYFARRFDIDAPHSVSVIGAGMIAFAFVFTWRDNDGKPSATEASLRNAIAAAIVVQYLVLVSVVTFFGPGPKDTVPPAITQTLLSSFTTVVGIVIAFYFGSSAYIQASKAKSDNHVNRQVASDSEATK